MVQNVDLITEILLFAEKYCDGGFTPFDVSKLPEKYHTIDSEILNEHIAQTRNNGLLEAHHASNGWVFVRLTENGYNRLSEIEEDAEKRLNRCRKQVYNTIVFVFKQFIVPTIVAVVAMLIGWWLSRFFF